MAYHLLKVFLSEDALVSLQDQFVDKEKALQKFIYEQVRGLCRTAKLCKINQQMMANIEKEGVMTNETYNLKEIDLEKYTLGSDESWLPEKYDKDSTTFYALKVGDNTYDLLLYFGQIYNARIDLYNDSIPETDINKKQKLLKPAECMEQIIHGQLITPIMNKITEHIDKELDKEYDELLKEDKKEEEEKEKKKKSAKT